MYSDDHNATPILRELGDRVARKIIISTIDSAKTVSQICDENKLPLSSIYKKIQRLHKIGVISIETINIDHKGKRIAFYRSTIKSLEFSLTKKGIVLELNRDS